VPSGARAAGDEVASAEVTYRSVVLLLATDTRFAEHDTGPGHPERAARLQAVEAGLLLADLGTDLVALARREATREELERVHPAEHLDALEAVCARRGHFDADTPASAGSWTAALTAAGAGLAAVDALAAGDARGAFLAIRPPGHHARPSQAMGFCLVNNVAVVAASLRDRGERVAIVDIDAHHGNGTQEIFYADPDVLYVSFHEWPLYPGTGRHDEIGTGPGAGTTCNLPLPAGATGDVYLHGMDEVVAPLLAEFAPTWVLISAGFDAHRDDPITGLGLSAADYATLTERLVALAPAGRVVMFLEGGYSLTGLRDSVAASIPALAGGTGPVPEGEGATNGGPGGRVVTAVGELWRERRAG
jgi:acetoin utilization deacetylase AcuC-like enzyme